MAIDGTAIIDGLIQEDMVYRRISGIMSRVRRCQHCNNTASKCNASGCGQRKAIGWRERGDRAVNGRA